jgi:FkbM family methyltransferase
MSNKLFSKFSWAYLQTKIGVKNSLVNIKFNNGLQFFVRAKSGDKSILQEVWLKNIYNKYGVNVNNGDTVIDVGAHIGMFSVYAAHLNPNGKVYSFEPFIENYNLLVRHKEINALNNLHIYNNAVSNTEGTQTLHIASENSGGHSLKEFDMNGKSVNIETINLSRFCEKNNINKINFLKLDCEGAEYEILFDDEKILNKVDKIIMEVHPYFGKPVDEMVALLEKYNFKVDREKNGKESIVEMIYAKKQTHN